MWSVSERGEFVLANNLCMESPESTSHKPHLSKCHEMGGLQEWKYHDDVSFLIELVETSSPKPRNYTST